MRCNNNGNAALLSNCHLMNFTNNTKPPAHNCITTSSTSVVKMRRTSSKPL